jgi:hypothetical protein
MAKKAVASLQKGGGKEFTKVVITTKSAKTGAYTFKESMVHNDKVRRNFQILKKEGIRNAIILMRPMKRLLN